MAESGSRFVVSQIDWARTKKDPDSAHFRRSVRTVRVAEFASFDEAEVDRRRREGARRAEVNPFHYGGASLFYQTSLDGPRLHDWLMDAGIEPPANPGAHSTWAAWWDTSASTWSAEQLAHAWAALDKIRFFTVTEEYPQNRAYVILELHWFRDWGPAEPTLSTDYEGGKVLRAFHTKAAAEAECARLTPGRQDRAYGNGFVSFTRRTRAGEEDAPELDISEAVFFEVVETEVEGEARTGPMYLVVRRAVDRDGNGCDDEDSIDTGSRVPLRLFAGRRAAEALVARLTAEARRTMNPFHLNGYAIPKPVQARLAALGFPLEAPKDFWADDWRTWWDGCLDQITDEQRAAVWAALDDTPPFEVIEVEMDE